MTTFETVLKRSNRDDLPAPLAGKLLAAIAMATLVLGLLLGTLGAAHAAPLPRAEVLVRSENIKLGDVFEGLSQHADFVLAPAPAPGQELVWNSPTLLRIATAFNLPWRPSNDDAVHIRRAAIQVDADAIRNVLHDHLATLNENDTYNVSITTPVPDIVISSLDAPRIELADFNMPASGGAFSAIVKVTGDDGRAQTVNLRGMAERIKRIPTLRHSVKNGEVIGEGDIVWVEQPANSVRKDVVLDQDIIIGSTPRKTINANELIRPEDLQLPLLVNRGDIVTMVFNHNGMYLTTKGRAMADGAKGQIIKVSNVGSSRMIEARVNDAKEVVVE